MHMVNDWCLSGKQWIICVSIDTCIRELEAIKHNSI